MANAEWPPTATNNYSCSWNCWEQLRMLHVLPVGGRVGHGYNEVGSPSFNEAGISSDDPRPTYWWTPGSWQDAKLQKCFFSDHPSIHPSGLSIICRNMCGMSHQQNGSHATRTITKLSLVSVYVLTYKVRLRWVIQGTNFCACKYWSFCCWLFYVGLWPTRHYREGYNLTYIL